MLMPLVMWMWVGWLAVDLVRAQGECGPNIVQMVTRNTPPCRLRFDTVRVDASSAGVKDAVATGRAAGDAKYEQALTREQSIVSAGVAVQRRTPEYHHYLFATPLPGAVETFRRSLRYNHQAAEVARAVTQTYGWSQSLAGDVLLHLNLPLPETCTPTPRCDATAPYRTHDGSCTNLREPKRGMAGEPFIRLLLPVYDDGIYSPRRSVYGSELPGPRELRTLLIQDRNVPDDWNSLAVMQWGQLVAHDVAQSRDQAGPDGLGVMCCTQDGQHLDPSLVSQGCYPVDIPANDPYMYTYNQRCMSVGRSNVTFALDCRLSAAQQNNLVNMLLDASLVYGFGDGMAAGLRTFQGGKLQVQLSNGRPFLPQSADPAEDCDRQTHEDTCFKAGDFRVNQNTGMSVLQVVLMREHNRVVTALAGLNPQWGDERLYQEARKILGAVFQHITYRDLVPLYVGRKYAYKLDLPPLESGYSRGYDDRITLGVLSSFTAASYRAFHGIAQGTLKLMDYNRCPVRDILLSSNMDAPGVLLEGNNFDQHLLGLVTQPSQYADEFFTTEITNQLFRTDSPWGQDLGALDIVRGRDHGLPCYNDFRELCGLPRAASWAGFGDWISDTNVQKMAALYKHPNDVDLFVGGFLEKIVPGALVGPTFQCIIGEQFYRLKFGDRFFYEFQDPHHGFRPAQLQEIRKASLSRLICDNGDNIQSMQRNSFENVSPHNPLFPCNNTAAIPEIDLTKWKE